MATFDFASFIIGLLLGMIIMLLIVWIAYYARVFVFSYCATTTPVCQAGDFINNPGEALANGIPLEEILFLNSQGELMYQRPVRTATCTPNGNSVVTIQYPQYCEFQGGGLWRETAFNSNIYRSVEDPNLPAVTTTGNCQPAPGMPYQTGKPVLKWDPSPAAE